MKLLHVGGGTFVDETPSKAPSRAPERTDIYPYARFRSLEHVSFGLRRTTGGPKGVVVEERRVGDYGMEPLARFWDFKDALSALKKGERWAFEEEPFVEITSEAKYDEVLRASGLDLRDGEWKGPGLYDFRDSPPIFSCTAEDYELEELESAGDDAIDFMYQGDEWEDAYRELASA